MRAIFHAMRARGLTTAVLIFAAAGSLGGAVVWQADRVWAADRREAASQVAAGAAFALEQQVSVALSATYALATLVRRDPEMRDFEAAAEEMLPLHGAVANLQLAPEGVIRRIHPLAGSEAALGLDLLSDPDRRFQAREALASRRLTLAGPFELRQGGIGILGRLAVFLRAPGAPGGERFWGFAIALVPLDALLHAARLDRLRDGGFRYQLTRLNAEMDRIECFVGCDAVLDRPVSFDVAVPNGRWKLALAPVRGWPAPPWRWPAWLLVLGAATACALLGVQVVRQPERLRREVDARTAELNRANAALASEMERLRVAEEAARDAREQLQQSRKLEAIGQLAGGIAHDFNNLLTGILGYASVLQEESPPGGPTREAADTIAAAAQRASELTRQLLGFARRQPLQALPFDAHAVIAEAARLFQRTVEGRIRVTCALGASRAVVLGDPGQLQQALLNLAVNARDAMPAGGVLGFETALVERDAAWAARHPGAAPGQHLSVSVSDTGHGISAEVRERMFEPFFTTKDAGRGTGLGLAMVYGFARSHHGAVEVASEVGRGARFTVSLPVTPPGVEPARAAPAARARAGAGTVLVVDDDPVPREATAAMLAAGGWSTAKVGSAADAERWLAAHPGQARFALVDVAMPGTSGVDCLSALRRLDPSIRAVLASGYAQDGRVQELVARGEARFLPKPFTLDQLAAALEEAPAGQGAAPESAPPAGASGAAPERPPLTRP